MNDLEWIKYKPKVIFLDTVGMSAAGERAHRRLCDYVWFSDVPPRNDNELLKQITSTGTQDWGRVKMELLGKGWIEAGEFLIHRGAIASLNESKQVYVANQNKTAAAQNRSRLALSAPDATTGVMRVIPAAEATPSVTTPVTRRVTGGQERRQGQGQVQGEDYLTSKLSFGGLQRGADDILNNKSGWDYDNCKVRRAEFTRAGLMTVMRPFVGRVLGRAIQPAWDVAVVKAHASAVDGQARDANAVCVTEFKAQLEAAAQLNGKENH